MPAVSKAQRRLMGACEHGAGYKACPQGMTKAQMADFAHTPEKGLPERKHGKKGGSRVSHEERDRISHKKVWNRYLKMRGREHA